MTDYYLGISPERVEYDLRSNVARFNSPLSGTTRTLERVGSRLAITWSWDTVNPTLVGQLRAFLHSQRGGANRFWAPVMEGTAMLGSFPASELISNNNFASGVAGWSAGSATALTASGGVLRLTRTLGASAGNHYAWQALAAVQHAPYANRVLTTFQSPGEASYGASLTSGSDSNTDYGNAPGLRTAKLVVSVTNPNAYIDQSGQTGVGAGSFREVAYTSAARCALVDNGPNALLQSDNVEHASWTKGNATGSAVAGISPDGVGDAPAIIENGANAQHYVTQSWTRASAPATACCYGYFKRRTGTRDVRVFVDDGASNGGHCVFNLGTGTAGSPTVFGTGTNCRASIVSAGNDWYFCSVVVTLPATAAVRFIAYLMNAGSDTYTGDTTSSIYAWRMGGALSTQHTRGRQTTTTAYADGIAQSGAALNLKGLPASTNGLLLAGDWAEVITPGGYSEAERVVAPLNSDAAGLGYLQFEPILRASPADNAAVIVRNPLGRFLLDDSSVKWGIREGGFQSCQFTAVEDIVP